MKKLFAGIDWWCLCRKSSGIGVSRYTVSALNVVSTQHEENNGRPNCNRICLNKALLIDEVSMPRHWFAWAETQRIHKTLFDQQGKEIMGGYLQANRIDWKEENGSSTVGRVLPLRVTLIRLELETRKENLEKAGWDANVTNLSGWSIAGLVYLIHSERHVTKVKDLAVLIFTRWYATILWKTAWTLNENLASFIGDLAAIKFVGVYKYGKDSKELFPPSFMKMPTSGKYTAHILRGLHCWTVFTWLQSPVWPIQQGRNQSNGRWKIVAAMDYRSHFNKQPSKR